MPLPSGRPSRDVDVLYYLVHSMGAGKGFEDADRRAANAVAEAAAAASVGRIVYLGGLHPDGVRLSPHLRSRVEVGEILMGSGVPTLVLQAGVVIGSGSASFEMVRHLTDVLPYMPAPKWVRNRIQPIAVRDVLYYLLGAARVRRDVNRAVDIGGPDVLRYGQMMNGYAVEAGLPQRAIAALPVLTPRLASHWVNLVTPIPRRVAMPLVESLQNECIVKDHAVDDLIPRPAGGLTSYRRAVDLALGKVEQDDIETSWQDGEVLGVPSDPLPNDPDWAGGWRLHRSPDGCTEASPVAVAGDPGDRRRAGLVLQSAAVGDPRMDGQAGRRRGSAPRAAASRPARRGRRGGLLAGRGHRARCPAASAGRDEGARAGVARDAVHARRWRVPGTTSGPCSSRAGSAGGCTGWRCCPSTGSSSRAWRTHHGRRGDRGCRHRGDRAGLNYPASVVRSRTRRRSRRVCACSPRISWSSSCQAPSSRHPWRS